MLATRSKLLGRSNLVGPVCEALENRQVLAVHAVADFFPLAGVGNTWTYGGSVNGVPVTAAATLNAGPVMAGVQTSKLQTVFTPVGDTGTTATSSDTRFYAMTAAGLRLYREDITSPEMVSRTLFGDGAVYLTSSVADGAVIHIVKPFTGSSSTSGRSWTGQFVGDMTVVGLDNIRTGLGTFEALKITLLGSLTENGSTGWTATGTINETSWIVRGLGVAHIDYSSAITFSDQDPQAFRFNLGLTSAGRLGDVNGVVLRGKGVDIPFADTQPHTFDGSNFGGIDVDAGVKTRVFRIFNDSTQPFTFAAGNRGTVSVTGVNASDFAVIHQPTTIQPGASDFIAVQFNPSALGFRYATVSFAATNTTTAFAFDIRGTGLNLGRIVVHGSTGAAIANNDNTPSSQDGTAFGSVATSGTARIQRIFTIANISGSGTLDLYNSPRIVISGADATDFTVTLMPGEFTGPQGTATFKVSFDPLAVGLRTAVVSILTNDPLNPLFSFTISGTGL
jgi:hypothetical protein